MSEPISYASPTTAMPIGRPVDWPGRIAMTLLAALVLLTFGRIIGYGPMGWDDQYTIFENESFRPVTGHAYVEAWTKAPMAIYMPVTRTCWTLLASAASYATPDGYSIDAGVFRIFSVALHVTSTLLAFVILRRLFGGNVFAAAIGAALFAVHPLQVESVAWISGQKDLLAGCFTLVAIWLALHLTELPNQPRTRWIIAMWIAATLAMLSKPQAVVAPAMIAIALSIDGMAWRRIVKIVAPLLVPAILMAWIGRAAQPASLVDGGPLWARPLVALDAVGWYVAKLVVPIDLTLDYGRSPTVVVHLSSAILFAGIAFIAIGILWLCRQKVPRLAAGALLAVVGVLPVLGFVKFDFQYYSTVADHYVYSSLFGVALAVGGLLGKVKRVVAVAVAVPVVLLPAILSFRQAGVWRDTDRLFEHNLVVNPTSFAAHRVLAFRATSRGDDRAAVELLREALQIHPRDPIANFNLANALVRLGDDAAAATCFEIAIAGEPEKSIYRYNYAILLIHQSKFDEAEHQLQAAIDANPNATESAVALAKLRAMRQGTP